MRDLSDLTSAPWPQLERVTTAEQYAHALRSFDTARIGGDREPGVVPFLDELRRRRAVTSDADQPESWFTADLRLSPDLADLWPLPQGLILALDSNPPFGGPGVEPEGTRTEEDLDRMVTVLGPLMLTAFWNGVWSDQDAESSPGEFGGWISLGSALARKPEGEAWFRDSGLALD